MPGALGYDIAAIPLAAADLLDPMIAVVAMAFSSVSVVLNALRPKRIGWNLHVSGLFALRFLNRKFVSTSPRAFGFSTAYFISRHGERGQPCERYGFSAAITQGGSFGGPSHNRQEQFLVSADAGRLFECKALSGNDSLRKEVSIELALVES